MVRAVKRKKVTEVKPKRINPNKPLVFWLKCGTTNQLGPARSFASEAELKKAAIKFFIDYLDWARMFENDATKRIKDTAESISDMASLTLNTPREYSCLIDSYRGTTGVVRLWRTDPPLLAQQQTILK